jgi:V8-like Glu-specific endopeptidase
MTQRRIGLRATISMRRIVVVSASAALLLAVPVGATADAGSLRPAGKPTPASVFGAIGHVTTQTDAQIRAFWTPRRQQEALANPLPAPTTDQSPGSLPAEPPGPALSAPGGSPTVRTQSAQIPAALPGPHSKVWTRFTTAPATTIGQLLFRTPSGRVASCTATVIAAPNKNTIWTAGHCVNDGHTHWYSDFEFVPGKWSVHEPFGVWTYYEVEVPNLWYYSSLHGYDFAALALQVRSGQRVANLTGYQGFKFGYSTWNWKGLYVFGYPTEVFDPLRPVSSSLMRYCTGDAWKSGFFVFSQENIRCDMGPGASGGPWLQDLQLSRGWGYLVVNTSNHYGDDNSLNLRGPHLGSVALNVYNGVKNLP